MILECAWLDSIVKCTLKLQREAVDLPWFVQVDWNCGGNICAIQGGWCDYLLSFQSNKRLPKAPSPLLVWGIPRDHLRPGQSLGVAEWEGEGFEVGKSLPSVTVPLLWLVAGFSDLKSTWLKFHSSASPRTKRDSELWKGRSRKLYCYETAMAQPWPKISISCLITYCYSSLDIENYVVAAVHIFFFWMSDFK